MATPSADAVPLKFVIKRAKKAAATVHRLLGSRAGMTFADVLTAAGCMWGPSPPLALRVEYVDDEGDRVRVTNDAEWREALRVGYPVAAATGPLAPTLSAGKSFVLTVSKDKELSKLRKRAARRGGMGAPAASGDSMTTAASFDAPTTTLGAADAPSSRTASVVATDAVDTAPPADVELVPVAATRSIPVVPKLSLPARAAAADTWPAAPAAAATPKGNTVVGEPHDVAVMNLLSLLFNVDSTVALAAPTPTVDFGTIVTRTVDYAAKEVRVDVNRPALRHLALQRGCDQIAVGALDAAVTLLRDHALTVFPGDQLIAYNLACALSRRGDVEEALGVLKATAGGAAYPYASHVQGDADLAAVRAHPRYPELLRLLGLPLPALAAPATPHVHAAAAPAPVAETKKVEELPAESGLSKAEEQLLTIFPAMSVAEMRRVLGRAGGNVQKAIDMLLRS